MSQRTRLCALPAEAQIQSPTFLDITPKPRIKNIWDQNDSTSGRVSALHMTKLGLISSIPHDPLNRQE